MYVDGVIFAYGYGGGPGCSGLTPSQTNSIYNAPHGRPAGPGRGRRPAVFELSAYQQSDIDTWAHTLLRARLQPAAGQHHRRRRPAEPGLPGRRHLPAAVQRLRR